MKTIIVICLCILLLMVLAYVWLHFNALPTITMTDVKSAEIEDYNAPEREARYREEDRLQAKADQLLGVHHATRR